MSIGKFAYEAYCAHSDGKSLISGAPLPTWDAQDPRIQDGWNAAAEAAVATVICSRQSARADVYCAIDGERDYQEALARNTVRDQRPLEQLALIEVVIARAKAEFYDNPGQPAMDCMRKIAAIAVRAMEEHGAPERKTVFGSIRISE